ncbi:hypothetical protein COLO4_10949 [Corchorus olitorius]|uniref:Uncharacterized protein n=1 Tax=Corchorus olitorius TaxID=93759 RepID=A0A1R3K6C6_9ROSI|nr:hypothetical protein COLO4_10949 [Corchorus olitorius]
MATTAKQMHKPLNILPFTGGAILPFMNER